MSIKLESSPLKEKFKEELIEDESLTILNNSNVLHELIKKAALVSSTLKQESYKCPNCPRVYKILANLKNHQLNHDRSNFKFKCPSCKKKFISEDKLSCHHQIAHSKSNPGEFDCYICSAVFSNLYYLQTHLKVHIMKPLKCLICNSVTKHKRSFDRHLREVHKIRDRLRIDYLTEMGEMGRKDPEDENDAEMEPASKKRKRTSDDDDSELDSNEDLCDNEKELRRLNKLILQSTKVRDRLGGTGPKQYKCEICFKVYRQSEYLREHKKLHDKTAERYYCSICPTSFVIKKQLSAHVSMVHTTKQIQCHICSRLLKHIPSYRRHLKFTHKIHLKHHMEELIENRLEVEADGAVLENSIEEAAEEMDVSGIESEDYEMQTEENVDIDTLEQDYEELEETQSEMIEFVYVDAESIKTRNSSQQEIPEELECNLCEAKFTGKRELDRHVNKHFDKVDQKMAGKLTNSKTTVKIDNKMESLFIMDLLKNFDCDTCGESFPFEFLLKKHMLKHKVAVEVIEVPEIQKELPKESLDTDQGYCKYCDKAWNPRTLRLHKIHMHANELSKMEIFQIQKHDLDLADMESMLKSKESIFKHNCEQCTKFFYLKADLRKHIKSHRKNVKSVSCNDCHRKFDNKALLQCHYKNIHDETLKIYTCDYCGVKKARKRTMERHVGIHVTEAAFECNICHRKFKLEEYVKKHKLIHQVRERLFSCLEANCGRDFYEKMALRKHMRSHNIADQYPCLLCDRTFLQKKNLKKHQILHETLKCPNCSLSFQYYRQLEVHLWTKGQKCKIAETSEK